MNRRNPELVIHIGQHKTGSKALQSFLAWNRRALQDLGLFYPAEEAPAHGVRAYAISQFRLYALLRKEATATLAGDAAAAAYFAPLSPFCGPFGSARDFFESLDAEAKRAGSRRIVVSAEDLFDMHTAHETDFSTELVREAAGRLAALAAGFGYHPRVVAYLRRQDHLLGAHYVQYIKGSPDHDDDFDGFSRAFAPRLDTRAVLRLWADAFGPDRVRVRPYERAALPAGIVPDFFEHTLGLPVPEGCVAPPEDVESVNRSLDRDFVEFLRILNRRWRAGGSVFAREAVLEAALRDHPPAAGPTGVSAWLSPAARRDLIAAHREGNDDVARDFLGRADGRLFVEPLPDGDDAWRPYPGLTPDRATEIALAAHAIALDSHRRAVEHDRPPAVPMTEPVEPWRASVPARLVRKLRGAASRLGV